MSRAAGALRVLHVSQPTDGGTAAVVGSLARAGVEMGHEVTVASPSTNGMPAAITDTGAHWVCCEMSRMPHPSDVRAVRTIRRLALQTDVVHLHSSKAGALGRIALRTLPCHRRPGSCFSPHGWSWLVGGRMEAGYRMFERAVASWADTTIAVSGGEAAAGEAVLGPNARIRVIENGVDTERFSPLGPVADRSGDPLTVVVGRLTEQKGQDLAILALAQSSLPNCRLRLVGSGPAEPALRRLAMVVGVVERVEFAGEDDPRPHVRAADIVLVPSRWEGMSLVLLEAMACECAVVATDVWGTEILRGAGVIVSIACGAPGLAIAMDDLLRNPTARSDLGRLARIRVCERFTIDRTLSEYFDQWNQLYAVGRSRRGSNPLTAQGHVA